MAGVEGSRKVVMHAAAVPWFCTCPQQNLRICLQQHHQQLPDCILPEG